LKQKSVFDDITFSCDIWNKNQIKWNCFRKDEALWQWFPTWGVRPIGANFISKGGTEAEWRGLGPHFRI